MVSVLLYNRQLLYAVLIGVPLLAMVSRLKISPPNKLKPRPIGMLGTYLVAGLGFALLVNATLPVILERRMIYLLSGLAILTGYALAMWPRRGGLRWIVLGFLVIISLTAPRPDLLFGDFMFRQAVESIESQREPNDLVYFQFTGHSTVGPFRYYARRVFPENTPFLSINDLGQYSLYNEHNQIIFANEVFADYIWTRNRFWVVHSNPDHSPYGPPEVDWVGELEGRQFDEVKTIPLSWMTISLFTADAVKRAPVVATPLPDKQALPLDFGNTFELVNYQISQLTVQPGDEITIWLDWSALRPPDEDYAVYVHLLDDTSVLRGQADGTPSHVGRPVPTTLWATNTLIYDTHTITVNPGTLAGESLPSCIIGAIALLARLIPGI